MLKRTLVGMLLPAAVFLFHSSARADVFRCVGSGGSTMYTDLPCPPAMRTANVITSAQVCGGAGCGGAVEQGEEPVERSGAAQEQPAAREEELRRVEQNLAAREEALRRAEQELAVQEQESLRRSEEDARLAALWPREEIAPAAPYYEAPLWYPVVVVPSRPCVGPRCFPHHPPHKPNDPHHHPMHQTGGDSHDKHAGGAPVPRRQEGRQFAKQ